MISKELKEILDKSGRYSEFVFLDEAKPFNELFKDEEFDCVQTHSTQIFDYGDGEKDICGFNGQFAWKNNELTSLDGDSYDDAMLVIGYEKFTNEEYDVKSGIDVLV